MSLQSFSNTRNERSKMNNKNSEHFTLLDRFPTGVFVALAEVGLEKFPFSVDPN